MGSRPPSIATRTAEGGAAATERAQPCLARVFICDRPRAKVARYPLGALDQVTIGRGADETSLTGAVGDRRLRLRLDDSWMSRAHATLSRAGHRWRVEDAGSKNGTLLGGRRIDRATLADGDVLEIGQTLFVYRAGLAGAGDVPAERDRPRSPAFDDVEDFGLAVAAALTRLGRERVRFLPAAARALLDAWPVDLDACLRAATASAGGAAIAPEHLPTPLPRPAAASGPDLRLDGDLFAIRFGAAAFHLEARDGLRYLAHLVERPGVEVHVLELVAVAKQRGAPDAVAGDAGPLLDAAAKAAYRQRIVDLRAAADEATAFGDQVRAARAHQELDLLATELARAVGLGGRDRKAAAAAERARVNVTLRIRGAIKRIGESCPPLGQHLERAVRTGAFCSYQPAGAPT